MEKKLLAKPTPESREVGASLQELIRTNESIAQLLSATIDKLGVSASPYCIFISTLAQDDIQVVKPIPVTIEREAEDSFIASFIDAGVTTGGKTLQDAIWSLQSLIASSLRILEKLSDDKLGPKMRREKAVLLEFLCRSSRKPTRKAPRKN